MRVLTIVIAFALLPASALAQWNTQPKWDFQISALYQNSESAGGENGSFFEMDQDWGLGISFNYAWTSNFSLGADLDWLSPDYRTLLVDADDPDNSFFVDHSASQFNGRIKGTYNFTQGPWVPYVQLGIGWTWFDSNVADGPPQTGCWWHPWWGFICSNFYRTYQSTEFSYGAAAGLKYNLPGNTSFINLSFDYWRLDTGGDRADPSLSNWRLSYGWRF